MTLRPLLAAVDLGGTTSKFAVADERGEILAKDRVPTTGPAQTLSLTADRLRSLAHGVGGRLAWVGIGCFGPVDVDASSRSYGTILATPKPGWSGAAVLSTLTAALGVPGTLDTDVNAALAGERLWGAAKDARRSAYVTVGTGIGVGIASDGIFAARPRHPELGHVRVERRVGDEGFEGRCGFHGGCLEGLAAAPALTARFGPLDRAGTQSAAWPLAGHYLAQLTVTLVLGFRVERILFGGGVSNAPALIGEIRAHHDRLMAGYVEDVPTERLIVRAHHGDEAGLHGACALALGGAESAGHPVTRDP